MLHNHVTGKISHDRRHFFLRAGGGTALVFLGREPDRGD